jgi:pimeloyl-ACP methyl ester carboxylesterase
MTRLRKLLLQLVGVLLLLVVLWFVGHQVRRAVVEVDDVEALAPRTGRWVSAGDLQIFVQEWGPPAGPVVVLTHGTGAWSGTWFDTPQRLAAAGWRVVAVDLPPFGFTRVVEGVDYSRPAQGRRLLALMKEISTQPVTLVGHSFGAGPALEAAMAGPSAVRHLVLVDAALGLGPNGEMPTCTPPTWAGRALAVRPVRTVLVGSVATVPQFSGHLLRQFVHRQEVVLPEKIVAYQAPFGRRQFSAYLGDWAHAFANGGCEPALSQSSAELARWAGRQPRVSIIWGEQDTVTPLAQGEALRRMTGAELVTMPGVGHIPHLEDPDGFHRALLGVLR